MEENIEVPPQIGETEIKNVGAWGKNGEEKQELLYSSRVMVVGSNTLAQMILANLLGLGIRNLCCIDEAIAQNGERTFLYSSGNGKKRAKLVTAGLKRINNLTITSYYNHLFKGAEEFKSEIIVDATNDSLSKKMCLDYCIEKSIPFLSTASSPELAVLSLWNPDEKKDIERLDDITHHEFMTQRQGIYTSGVIAGLTAEQVRKLKFQVDDVGYDAPINTGKRIRYSPHFNTQLPTKSFRDLSVLIVGAGAVGNFAALNLALLGIGNIDIMDGDKIEWTNLNRQLLLYGRVGDFKAEVLSERIKEIGNGAESHFYNFYLTEEHNPIEEVEKKYDFIFSCADNYTARYVMNNSGVKHQICMIEGGTFATSGSVAVYVPGKNRCLDCRFDLKKYAKEEQTQASHGTCWRDPNPAIVVPNMIIGSAMAAELVNILSGNLRLLDKLFVYDTLLKEKIGLQHSFMTSQCELNCA